jgi:nuclear cap-binding protein subunit 1
VPDGPPLPLGAAPPCAAAALRAAYPARGGLLLLPRDKIECGRPAVERIVAEEYVLDSVAAYDGRRVELATLLTTRLPLPYDHTGVLIETLLGAMARLPAPELRPVAYHTLLMDVTKLARESPKYMAAWVRATYDRVGALDPEVGARGAAQGGRGSSAASGGGRGPEPSQGCRRVRRPGPSLAHVSRGC